MHAYSCYRQSAGIAAACLATNGSNAVAYARVTNTYSGSYEPRALPLSQSEK